MVEANDHLARLPAELFLQVAESPSLSTRDLLRLALTNSRYTGLAISALYNKNIEEEHASALLWAVLEENTNTMAMLVRYGADINSVDASTHLHRMKSYQWARRPWYAHEGGQPVVPLMSAIWLSSFSTPLRFTGGLLLPAAPPAGAPANPSANLIPIGIHNLTPVQLRMRATLPPFRFTPLALAVRKGHVKAVKWLLRAGADPNVPAKNLCGCGNEHHLSNGMWRVPQQASRPPMKQPHWTPLHIAIEHGYDDIVGLLVAHGANTRQVCRPRDGPWSALHTAFMHKRVSVIESLMDRLGATDMAHINARGRHGITPLHVAYLAGSTKTSAELDAINAPESDKTSLVNLALQYGAYVNLEYEVDGNKWTLFSMACAQDDWSLALRLLKLGANANFDLERSPGGRWTTHDFRSALTGVASAALARELDRLARDHEVARLDL